MFHYKQLLQKMFKQWLNQMSIKAFGNYNLSVTSVRLFWKGAITYTPLILHPSPHENPV